MKKNSHGIADLPYLTPEFLEGVGQFSVYVKQVECWVMCSLVIMNRHEFLSYSFRWNLEKKKTFLRFYPSEGPQSLTDLQNMQKTDLGFHPLQEEHFLFLYIRCE